MHRYNDYVSCMKNRIFMCCPIVPYGKVDRLNKSNRLLEINFSKIKIAFTDPINETCFYSDNVSSVYCTAFC
jgi:hypothetical protein